jgi:ferric-chelate reductase
LTFPAFFITICVHTPYAAPWIYPPLALYGADLLVRLVRFRIKDATLLAPDSQMTLVSSPSLLYHMNMNI